MVLLVLPLKSEQSLLKQRAEPAVSSELREAGKAEVA